MAQYIIYDIGMVRQDSTVEVRLSAATNVRLIDKVNMDLMKSGQQYRCYGGFVTTNPYTLPVPETRHWFVTIDLVGTLRHSVMVHPPKLPEGSSSLDFSGEG